MAKKIKINYRVIMPDGSLGTVRYITTVEPKIALIDPEPRQYKLTELKIWEMD